MPVSFDRVAILGAGGMGTALAVLLARTGREIRLWARDPAQAAVLQETGRNDRHLPGIILPEGIGITAPPVDCA